MLEVAVAGMVVVVVASMGQVEDVIRDGVTEVADRLAQTGMISTEWVLNTL